MGKIREPELAKLIVGMISGRSELFKEAEELLAEKFGPADFESVEIDFDFTEYYTKETGSNLKRKFLSFRKLIHPEGLIEAKLFTNQIEEKLSVDGRRRINLDPGYLQPGKFVLASTKDHQHRVYLGKGVYAEVTLRFVDGSFRPWNWTYPDYRTKEYIRIFNEIREIYKKDLKDGVRSSHNT